MAAIKMVTQLSSQPRTSQPSAYSRQYSQHQRQRQLPQLPSKSFSYPVSSYKHQHNAASGQITSTYMPVRNRLAEQESRPMNQTYTIGMANRIPMRNRSSSIDSDFADYTIHGAISGLFPGLKAPNSATALAVKDIRSQMLHLPHPYPLNNNKLMVEVACG